MSWQSYVDDQLIGTGFVKQAALHGLDGNPWATSSGFNVAKNEASALVSAMADPSPLYR
jgi:profilin